MHFLVDNGFEEVNEKFDDSRVLVLHDDIQLIHGAQLGTVRLVCLELGLCEADDDVVDDENYVLFYGKEALELILVVEGWVLLPEELSEVVAVHPKIDDDV
jgi:hypothetical protein